MSILKVARMGHPVLRTRAREVEKAELKQASMQKFIDDMIDTMHEYHGVGLAAPQVHEGVRIFVAAINPADDEPLSPEAEPMVFVNPVITPVGPEIIEDWEGCLSIPDLRGRVPRPLEIKVTALDRAWGKIEFTSRDFPARVIQHETDHLDGVLFLDRMKSLGTLSFLDEYAEVLDQRQLIRRGIMGTAIRVLLLALLFASSAAAQNRVPTEVPNGLPDWAFNLPDKVQPPTTPVTGVVRVPGSSREYDAAKIAGNANPPDWFPDEHGPAPRVVTGEPGVAMQACGSCHLMSGQGHPEAADIAGLPVEYFVRQMQYYKSGTRKEEDRMGPIARATSDEDVRKAAEYFAALRPIPWVKVIETSTPPKTYVGAGARHRLLTPGGGTEPMGRRIVEIPVDPARTALRDPRSPFLAYVPPGSIQKGEALVKTGGAGRTVQCAICHGDELKGLGEVPRIAGMQPVYVARQLITMQNGASAGKAVALMKKVVVNLSEDDIISISAYLGSLAP